MTTTLTKASTQWRSRPDDERFVSLLDMQKHFHEQRARSRSTVVSSKRISVQPVDGDSTFSGLQLVGPAGRGTDMTNYAFGQLASLVSAPGAYLRELPAPIAADALNYGIQFNRDAKDVGLLLTRSETAVEARAITGPKYGRVWNSDIVDNLVSRLGDGVSGDWRVPGEFGKRVEVTKGNTTLYASDRDMFVFLADEENRIDINRAGQSSSLARGFFVWNSEVGASTLGIGMFLFDYVCCNRIVWGAEGYIERRIRHTASAPDRFADDVVPLLQEYAHGAAKPVADTVAAAQSHKLDDVADFMAKRFGPRVAQKMRAQHEVEEGRPVATRWDAITAATAYAREIPHQDARVTLETEAGKLLAF